MKRKKRRFIFSNGLHGGNRYYAPGRNDDPDINENEYMMKDDVYASSASDGYSATDPQGSWTGVPRDDLEMPVQDADDL